MFVHTTVLLTPITRVTLSGLKKRPETSAPWVALVLPLHPDGGVEASAGTEIVTVATEGDDDVEDAEVEEEVEVGGVELLVAAEDDELDGVSRA